MRTSVHSLVTGPEAETAEQENRAQWEQPHICLAFKRGTEFLSIVYKTSNDQFLTEPLAMFPTILAPAVGL